jgi:hypothetical protein
MLCELGPAAERLGAAAQLADAHALLADGGEATRQRAVGAARGAHGLAAWLAERFHAQQQQPPPVAAVAGGMADVR